MIRYAMIDDEATKRVTYGLGTDTEFYQSIGMTEMEIEQSDVDGLWYVSGYAPMKSEEEKQLEEQQRLLTEAKMKRAEEVASITVEIDGMVFDGDGSCRKQSGGHQHPTQHEQEKRKAVKKALFQSSPYQVIRQPWDLVVRAVFIVGIHGRSPFRYTSPPPAVSVPCVSSRRSCGQRTCQSPAPKSPRVPPR